MLLKDVKENLIILNEIINEKSNIPIEIQKEEYGRYQSYSFDNVKIDAYRAKSLINMKRTDRDYFSKTMIEQMLKFVNLAEELGFIGYVYFRTGTRNGMWAYTRMPDEALYEDYPSEGAALYHSFESDSNYYILHEDIKNGIQSKEMSLREIKKEAKEKGFVGYMK